MRGRPYAKKIRACKEQFFTSSRLRLSAKPQAALLLLDGVSLLCYNTDAAQD
jgi:hypothetical protein